MKALNIPQRSLAQVAKVITIDTTVV